MRHRHFLWLVSLALACVTVTCPAARRLHAELATVTDAEVQPLLQQTKRLAEALDFLGRPLPAAAKESLQRAQRETDDQKVLSLVQKTLDPFCLFGVHINPETRVKVVAGPAAKTLVEQGWRVFLVKVHNEAGSTAPLADRTGERRIPCPGL